MSRVLVVDDEEAYRDLMAKHLERKGFNVDVAADGVNALELLGEAPEYDVLVTDLMMPQISGLELLKEAKDKQPDLEVIVITASNDVDNAVTAMRDDGAYDYLIKPLETISELSFSVGRAVQHRTLKLEKDQLNQRLQVEHDRLDALVRSTVDAIIAADGEGMITVVNPTATELIGVSIDVGAEAESALPGELYTLVENWTAVEGPEPSMVEISWPPDRVHNVSLTPFGGAGGWIMVLRDITHLRNLDDLKLRMLTEAAGRIRLPLAQAISRLADLSESSSGSSDTVKSTVYSLSTLLGKIQNWIDELLALMRLEAGIGFDRSEVQLTDLLTEEMVRNFEETFQDKGLNLEISKVKDLPAVCVDRVLMEKILHALLNRAAVRSLHGGLVRLDVSTRRSNVWVEVIDDGLIGASGQTDGDGQSPEGWAEPVGMSLAMVRAIVGSLGGQIWVQGKGAMGSTIALALPGVGLDRV